MTDSDSSCDVVYVHTDLPAGVTIREWRAERARERLAMRAAAREARRRRRSQRLPRWLGILRLPALRPRFRREVHG
jgi:hypothetical protein